MRITAIFLVVISMLSGCATGGGNVFLKKDFSTPLGKYTAAVVKVDAGNYPASITETENFRVYFTSMLGKYNVFNDIVSEEDAKTMKSVVRLKCVVAEYNKIDDIQRFVIGSMAGKSSIKIDVEVVDMKTKETIGIVEASGITAGPMKRAVEKAAELAAQELSGLK